MADKDRLDRFIDWASGNDPRRVYPSIERSALDAVSRFLKFEQESYAKAAMKKTTKGERD